jgi:hypothetical protein
MKGARKRGKITYNRANLVAMYNKAQSAIRVTTENELDTLTTAIAECSI